MKIRYVFHLALLINFNNAWADLGLIQDQDGYTNIRLEPNLHAKIVGQIKSGDIIDCDSSEDYMSKEGIKNGFCSISTPNPDIPDAYLHKSRFFPFSHLEKVPLSNIKPLSAHYQNKHIFIDIAWEKFTPRKSDFSGCATYNNANIYSTNCNTYKGTPFYGTDNVLPTNHLHYKSISGLINKKSFSLSSDQIDGLFTPNVDNIGQQDLERLTIYYDPKNDKLFITGINSDGAGSYFLVFVIKNGLFEKRLVWNANR